MGYGSAGYSFKILIFAQDFPGGPVVKNLPSSVGDVGSITGGGTKILQDAAEAKYINSFKNFPFLSYIIRSETVRSYACSILNLSVTLYCFPCTICIAFNRLQPLTVLCMDMADARDL